MVIWTRMKLFAYSIAFSLAVGSALAGIVPMTYSETLESPSDAIAASDASLAPPAEPVAAPETTTWAVMLLCVAGVGFAVFRRNPKQRLDGSAL
jgi:hypothetical protein